MESVLVGIDHSEASRRALRFALERAAINEWRLRVVHVINWSRYSIPTLPDLEQRPLKLAQERAHAKETLVDPLLEQLREEGLVGELPVTSAVLVGRPSEVLIDLVTRERHDLAIVARTGESNLRHAIFGSTASRLAQHSPVPVVVVP